MRARLTDAVLVLSGAAGLLALGSALGQEGPAGLPIVVALGLLCVGLIGLGLYDHLPERAERGVRVVGVGGAAGGYVALAVACLVSPGDTVGSSWRAPDSVGEARAVGLLMLGVPAVLLLGWVAWLGWRRVSRPSDPAAGPR